MNRSLVVSCSSAVLVGFVTGLRSTVGSAVAAHVAAGTSAGLPARLFRGRRARESAGVALLGELIGDKLPSAPSRLEPAGLVPRILNGALGAAVLAQMRAAGPRTAAPRAAALPPVAAGVLGAGAAYAGARAGAWYRAATARSGRVPDTVCALGEDAVAVGGGLLATRLA